MLATLFPLFLAAATGAARAAVAPHPTVVELLTAVSQLELEPVVAELSGERPATVEGASYHFTTRSSSSGEPIDMAERYVFEQLESYGLDSVRFHDFPAESGAPPGRNIVGQIDGTARADEIVIIGAHLDDRPWVGTAPGADDNASGVSVVLLLARSFAGLRFERTIRFAIFGDEENAPWDCEEIGSVGYAAMCREQGEDIVAMIAVDAIAYDPPESEAQIVELNIRRTAQDSDGGDRAIADLWLEVIEAYGIDEIEPRVVATGNSWSDHGSFWKHGYPAALLVAEEQEHWNPNWHTPGDTIDTLAWPFYVQVARSSLALTAHLAGIEGTSQDSGVSDTDTDTGKGPGGCRCAGVAPGLPGSLLTLVMLALALTRRRALSLAKTPSIHEVAANNRLR